MTVRVALLWALLGIAAPLFATDVQSRVASLNLAADEVLVELLPPGRLVSVTKWADDPETSNIVGRVPPSVFRFEKADMEQLVALRPRPRGGFRVHRRRLPGPRRALRDARPPHAGAQLPGRDPQAILDLGKAVGAEDKARQLVARYDATLQDLGTRLTGAPRSGSSTGRAG